MNISRPVPSSIKGVSFEFLTDDEIKSLSVKRIVNPLTYDALDNVVPGGLYDLALGAYLDNPSVFDFLVLETID
jgi:DNA-directed RNA polymerase I subunit RPA1